MASEDFGQFGRRSVDRDDFDDMREQMAKERDKFFRDVNPMDWQRDAGGPGRQGHFTLVGSLFNQIFSVSNSFFYLITLSVL